MGVGNNGRLAEHVAHDQVGALAAHAGQAEHCVKIVRHLAAEVVPQAAHAKADVPCLGAAQSAGLYDGFDLLRLGSGQCLHTGIFGEQILAHHVHPGIGALSGQAYLYQQLPGMVVIQGAFRDGIGVFQALDHFQCQGFCGHG